MSRIYPSLVSLIGNTPLVELSAYSSTQGLSARLLGKCEFFNPGGSVKDRIALAMIEAAEKEGILGPKTTIIEPTSGNTGIGLAMIAAQRGYKIILTMSDAMSVERRSLLAAYGATLILTPAKEGMKGAIAKAQELAATIPNSFIPSQFTNQENPKVHYHTTGVEIWRDTAGTVDILVAAVGTGGTLSGAGRYLKEQNKNLKVVAVEPADSAVLQGKPPGPHLLQGIGAGFIPQTLDQSIYDEVVAVTAEEAFATGPLLVKTEGILAGISSATALHAATTVAKRAENRGKTIVVIFPDTGERYLSTPFFGT